jgi:hypothetical protein
MSGEPGIFGYSSSEQRRAVWARGDLRGRQVTGPSDPVGGPTHDDDTAPTGRFLDPPEAAAIEAEVAAIQQRNQQEGLDVSTDPRDVN